MTEYLSFLAFDKRLEAIEHRLSSLEAAVTQLRIEAGAPAFFAEARTKIARNTQTDDGD